MVSYISILKKYHVRRGRTKISKKFETPLREDNMRCSALNKSRVLVPNTERK